MKVRSISLPDVQNKLSGICLAVVLVSAASVGAAQDSLSLEDLEKMLAEQKIALEEAIANREATAAKAQEIVEARNESDERKRQLEEELRVLCEEQESLQEGSFGKCMSNSDS